VKKILVLFGLLALAALDWAALHDILKKQESSYVAEWMVVISSAVIFAASAFQFFRKRAAARPS
jgi:hypothetical protein